MVATLISNGGALDTNNLGITEFLSATSYSHTATQVFASFGGGRSQILLGSFVFDGSGTLVGGTITGIVESRPGGGSYQISSLNLPVTTFLGFLNAGDGPGLIATLFAGNDGVLGGNSNNDTLSGGAGADSLSGLGGDDVLDGGAGSDQLVGGAGNDTYFVDSFSDQVIESDVGTDTVIATVDFGLGFQIENLTLAGTATIAQGNELANVLTGNAQANTLLGMQGNDTLLGNDGNDAMAGGTENDLLIGGNGNDTLDGEAGNDTLDGGTGNDKMMGGDGDDTYTVDGTSDTVIELSGKGIDSVFAAVDHQLASNVENLTLTGGALIGIGNTLNNSISGDNLNNQLSGLDGNDTISGGDGNDALTGGQGNDSLLGGDGNDTLDGGPGNDTMEGGKGDDIYLVDASGDLTIEAAGGGIDTVVASVSHQLASEIENLTLVGSALTGSGNALNNVITGNGSNNELHGLNGNDTLDGGAGADSIDGGHDSNTLYGGDGNDTLDGGTGADSMNGGLGDDLYLVEGQEDVVEFETDGGIDTVQSTGSFTLGSGIENLTLKDGATSGNGNELDNVITGNGSRNLLNGGKGNDTILAGADDDFVKGNAGDDLLDGGDHNDNIEGNEGADSIFGGDGKDFLLGGGGDDTLAGGADNDTVAGQIGNDTLDGGAGADYLEGGKGDDIYYVDDAADVVREFAGEGTDTVLSTVDVRSLGVNIENVTLLGSDDTFAAGNDAANLIIGNAGNNFLDGAGGNDTIAGGAGDDVYLVEGGDVIIENADEGFDTIWALSDYELGANIEILVAVGAGSKGIGNALANEMYAGEEGAALYGLEGADTLIGGSGNDTLIGGAGDDSMAGGADNDVYGVDSKFDQIIELFGDGFDQVESSIDFELGENLESLILLSGAMVGKGNSWHNQLQGNDDNNVLFGNDGDDSIDGGGGNDIIDGGADNDTIDGGAGNDTIDGGLGWDEMYGGLGDDLFLVDDESDFADDDPFDSGIDTVHSTAVSFTLGSGIENLVLKDAAWFGGGNELDNTIVGSEFDNSLDGADGNDSILGDAGNDELSGGSGADTLAGGADNDTLFGGTDADSMAGGAGDDLYGVDSKLDVVTELSGGGTDTVQSSVDYTLSNHLENLALIDTAYRGVGNSLANTITGNDGVNNLDGGSGNDTIDGGAGNDTLYGGFGNDQLYGGAGNDRIDCIYNQDRVMYTSVLDGHDLLTNFSTGGTGQDYIDLDGLFDSLGVDAANRAGRVSIVDNGGGADVCIDTDGAGGWDLNLASIQYVPDVTAITVGTDTTCDVFVGT